MPLPKSLQPVLWSYDIQKMDPKNKQDKRIIIQQVLNHGTWEHLRWLLQTYSEKEIEEVVKRPSRGIWWEDAMNYWTKYFKLKMPSKKILFSINPKKYAGVSFKCTK